MVTMNPVTDSGAIFSELGPTVNYGPVGPDASVDDHLAAIDTALGAIVLDHGLLLGLADDDHPNNLYTLQAGNVGRAGGQALVGGTAAGEELLLRGTSDANLGQIRLQAPIDFDDTSAAVIAGLNPYFVQANPSQTITVGFVGGVFNASPTITFSNGFFIWEALRGAPDITSLVDPGFAAFALFQGLPILRAGSGFNPLQAIVMNAGVTTANDFAQVAVSPNSIGVSWSPQTRTSVALATMTLTAQTGLRSAPTFSTVALSTANLGTIRAVHALTPAVALFQPAAGTETMTAYYGLDYESMAFGGNVPKVVVRSQLPPASAAYFLRNLGGAQSDFGGGTLLDCGQIQIDSDAVGLVLGEGQDIELSFNGTQMEWDPVIGDTLRWDFSVAGVVSLDSPSAAVQLQVDLEQISFGPSLAGNQFALFAPPSLRTPGVAGEYHDILFSAAGNLDINGLAMGNVSAWNINSLSITLSGGSITDLATFRVSGMTTSGIGAADTHAIKHTGRRTGQGVDSFPGLTPSLGADQNDYTPATGNSMRQVVYIGPSVANVNITGFGFIQNDDTYWVVNTNNAANTVTLQHQNAGSAAANRIISPTGADYVLGPNESALVIYDPAATRWRILWGTGA